MFVELIYDKRNFEGLPGANDMILGELTKRIHRIFPDAKVRVKPMMSLPAKSILTPASMRRSGSVPLCRRCLKKQIFGVFMIKHKILRKTPGHQRQKFRLIPSDQYQYEKDIRQRYAH